jgi:hypothetical protein
METQTTRIHFIEEELLLATQDILPSSNESKTITELAELCRLTQMATRQKLDLLKRRLQEAGYVVQSPKRSSTVAEDPQLRRHGRVGPAATSRNIKSPPPSSVSWPLSTNIGGPLESVVEGDVETDGATTPGSMLQSPIPWNSNIKNTGGRKTATLTTTTTSPMRSKHDSKHDKSASPSMDRLSLSASTTNLLQKQQQQPRTPSTSENYEQHHSRHGQVQLQLRPPGSNSTMNLSSFVKRTPQPKLYDTQQQQQYQYQRPWNAEFREEDDMITLDTQSTLTKNASPVRKASHGPSQKLPKEDRSSFLARMEGMLDRVEETIREETSSPRRFRGDEPSRPSDEIQASLSMTSYTKQDRPERQQTNRQRVYLEEESYSVGSDSQLDSNRDSTESYDDEEDDSTNLAPTLVAEKDRSFQRTTSNDGVATTENKAQRPHPLNTLQQQQQRPTHIVVDTAMGSPAHTNITMDATVMNETFASFLGMDENQLRETIVPIQENEDFHQAEDNDTMDNLSTVTPILDRYRLDPDDENSVGVKVVPNERGSHKKGSRHPSGQKQRTHPFLSSMSKPKTPKQAVALPRFSASHFLSPQTTNTPLGAHHTPSSVSTRSKKVYRKTPFPKRKGATNEEDGLLPTLNENDHPNTSTGSSAAASPENFQKSIAPVESISISVPPLRPRSLDSRRLDEKFGSSNAPSTSFSVVKPDQSQEKNMSLESIDREESATLDQIDKTIERIDQELATGRTTMDKVDLSSGRMDPVGKSFLNQVKSMTKKSPATTSSKKSTIRKISSAEFDAAPRIVRTQVSVNEANDALDLLQEFCTNNSMDGNFSLQFSEERGHEILSSLTGSKHRSKSILISLCHWQRLSMRRDTARGTMVFVMNTDAKDRTFLC